MYREDYPDAAAFRNRKTCSARCGGSLNSEGKWSRLLAYPVRYPMEFEEIARVAGVSRQRIFQVYDDAIRKLANNPAARRDLKGFLE